jgi:hypothetical protein
MALASAALTCLPDSGKNRSGSWSRQAARSSQACRPLFSATTGGSERSVLLLRWAVRSAALGGRGPRGRRQCGGGEPLAALDTLLAITDRAQS